ncbi:major tail protein with Ig-like domain [Pseudomonas phage UF_RH7]|nr:major tail protein with Ig-like domain [Pseudomonas phage UF_RH7]
MRTPVEPNYVIGRGELHFNKFATGTKTGTGEMYFGNTPELSAASSIDTLDHYNSDHGLKEKDESVTLEDSQTLTFSTDHIAPENLALWFGGDLSTLAITAATGQTYSLGAVILGRSYQIGASATTPSGARKVTNVVVKKGATTVAPEGNYEVDLELGRVYIESDATDVIEGDVLEVTFDQEAYSRQVIVGKAKEIRGALRFISDNPVGKQKDMFWPYVKITPNGDYALKGDEWQVMSFTVEVLKLNGTTERVYIDMRDATV